VVRLTRIYTRLGDEGDTHLGDMSRARKTSARVVAYGDVDELNAVLGVARAQGLAPAVDGWLSLVQNDLFDLGADLCVPAGDDPGRSRLRVDPSQVQRLERWCDEINDQLPDLTSFVLPAGTPGAAALHHARTVCRRAERSAVALADAEPVTREVLAYLNRLSDLLFILARAANREAGGDVLWVPGESR
jgi:cob(I)alamin adenosyltransferase